MIKPHTVTSPHRPGHPGARLALSGLALSGVAWQLTQAHAPGDLAPLFTLACAALGMLPWLALLALVQRLPVPLSAMALAAMAALELSAACFVTVGHVDYGLAHYVAKPAAQAAFLALMLAAAGLLDRARSAVSGAGSDGAVPNER